MSFSAPALALGPPELYEVAARQRMMLKYGMVSVYTLFIYDAFTTIDDEIEYIWKQRFSAVTFLYILNRHYALFAFTFIFASGSSSYYLIYNFDTPWHSGNPPGLHSVADGLPFMSALILFEPLAVGVPFTILPDIVIGLRVYALYRRNLLLGWIFKIFLVAELGVGLWIYLTPSVHPAILPGPESLTNSIALHFCEGLPSDSLSNLQVASFQFMQTSFDTVALTLILWKTTKESLGQKGLGSSSLGGLRSLIMKHGVIYYIIVFTSNFAWAMMILFAEENLKYGLSQVAFVLAPLSANRLTISLRKYNSWQNTIPEDANAGVFRAQGRTLKRRSSWVGTSTFEMSEVDTWSETTQEYVELILRNDNTANDNYGTFKFFAFSICD
ncbi:hypothetical protein SCHPADRAFT_945795 [Schizopora paradoxa]|uniref:DUF6533 domain-containing protein n=1 Tax=Schizopora paradoxa TaxID=27342 RepID=A0A0H2R624_9AGAM|nr:hypothetical protein SCHPADRAFT_945795 [Schizopora paradoxa]